MLKNISNLGTDLSKKQQQNIQGGDAYCYGGCLGKSAGDPCYTTSGGCRSVQPGVCGGPGGSLYCIGF
ncbi:MAG: hypothetical protein ACI9Y7_001553 [Dokdonia sp.]|jgi:hypothetical protein